MQRAVGLLENGEPVALPTETVYGLAADALRPDAVLKIFEAKERPFFDPLIVHLPDLNWLDRIAVSERNRLVRKLVGAFWPGPLTLVLPRRETVPDLVTSGLATVAVRMSAHPVFRAAIEQFGRPLAAPSANRFGRISPTTAAHVAAELGGRIPLIVDGGPTRLGVESTIVAPEDDGETIRILRSGPVTPEELAAFGTVTFAGRAGEGNPTAPGQLKSHYAPRTRLILAEPGMPGELSDFEPTERRCGLLAWNPATASTANAAGFAAVELLSPTQDLREAAARLFAAMRRLDAAGLDVIVAEAVVPETGLGIAIMDRLRKAAGTPVP